MDYRALLPGHYRARIICSDYREYARLMPRSSFRGFARRGVLSRGAGQSSLGSVLVTTIEQVRAIKQRAEGKKMSLLGKLKSANATIAAEQSADPWLAPLQRVRGKVEFDGHERVSTQTLLDVIDVPQRSRTPGTFRRLAKLMAQLVWGAVRVRA